MDHLPAGTEVSLDIVCVPGASWWFPLWTNRQHLADAIARYFPACRVLYVNPPESVYSRLLYPAPAGVKTAPLPSLAQPLEQIRPNLWVLRTWTPFGLQRRWAAAFHLSRQAAVIQTRQAIRRLGFKDVALLVQWEFGLPFVQGLRPSLICYDRLDDHPNLAHNAARREMAANEEQEIMRRAQIVTAVAPHLLPANQEWQRKCHVVPPGVDFGMIRQAVTQAGAVMPAELAVRPRPLIGFHGNLSSSKIDIDLLLHAAQRRPEWTWVLVGPQEKRHPGLMQLAQLPNVLMPGFVPHQQVFSQYIRWMDALILPYHVDDPTLGSPMKTMEYLATGKPVVATHQALFEPLEQQELLRLACHADDFEAAIANALQEQRPDLSALRMKEAERHAWQQRAAHILRLAAQARQEG